jgi:hypothetical protein
VLLGEAGRRRSPRTTRGLLPPLFWLNSQFAGVGVVAAGAGASFKNHFSSKFCMGYLPPFAN